MNRRSRQKRTKYLQCLPQPLLDDIIGKRCVPIIGAGFSANAVLPPKIKMPLWDDLGKHFASQVQKDYPYTTPIDAISAFCHEFKKPKLVEELRKVLHADLAQPGNAHLAFADLDFDMIVTTNLDFLLESAYSRRSKLCYPILDEEQLSVNGPSQGTCILKLHGDLNHSRRLVMTEEDYDTFLEKSPSMATYLANLLISRTPLFIGYSLDDPDFRQIWQIIGSRLKDLRRGAFALGVNPQPVDVTRYERRGVKVISLPGKISDYDAILQVLFEELRDYWLDKTGELSTVTSDEQSLNELSLPHDAQTRLCFFSLSYRLLPFYRTYVFPIFERNGLIPITSTDMISPGDNIIATISSLMERASLVVADISGSNWVFSEVGMALANQKRVLLVKERGVDLPADLSNVLYIDRPKNLETSDIDEFLGRLNEVVRRMAQELLARLTEEPERLFAKQEYRAAILSAFSLFETDLRALLRDRVEATTSLREMLQTTFEDGYLNSDSMNQIQQWLSIRNRLAHTKENASKATAREIITGIRRIINTMRQK